MFSWWESIAGKFLGLEIGLAKWVAHQLDPWTNWADTAIHNAFRLGYMAYVILTDDLANFSYYVASFTTVSRQWTETLLFTTIPNAVRYAMKYAYQQSQLVKVYEDKQRDALRVFLLNLIALVATLLNNRITRVKAYEDAQRLALRKFLLGFIAYIAQQLTIYINKVKAYEDAQRVKLQKYLLALIAALTVRVNAIIPTVDKEAADGYNKTRQGRADLLSKIVGSLATDNPLVKDLVSTMVTAVLDLAVIDDPLLRLGAGQLLTHIINSLGVDKLAGGLAQQLLGGFLGAAPPATLGQVETDVGNRLNASEAQWQQFYDNGGDDVENLGKTMRESASPLFTIPLAGYFAAAVADPKGTAAATDAVVTPAARAIVAPLIAALGTLG